MHLKLILHSVQQTVPMIVAKTEVYSFNSPWKDLTQLEFGNGITNNFSLLPWCGLVSGMKVIIGLFTNDRSTNYDLMATAVLQFPQSIDPSVAESEASNIVVKNKNVGQFGIGSADSIPTYDLNVNAYKLTQYKVISYQMNKSRFFGNFIISMMVTF